MEINRPPSVHELRKDLFVFKELIGVYQQWQDQEAAQPLIEACEQRIATIRVQALLLGIQL